MKKLFEIGEKYYFEDLGIRHAIGGYRISDIGKILENLVFKHLQRNNYQVFVGTLEENEIDFIGRKGNEMIYLQVAYRIDNPKTHKREFGNLITYILSTLNRNRVLTNSGICTLANILYIYSLLHQAIYNSETLIMKRIVMLEAIKTLFLVLVFTFSFVVISSAQINQARFRHLTAKDGFTSATVNTIYKDSQGFIWLGAFDGLYRYDGYEFKVYNHDPSDHNSLSNNTIYNIIEDQNKVLWIGSMWSGLNKYNRIKDNFKRYYPNPDTSSPDVNGISCIYQDRAGTLWVSTPTGGLHQYIDSADSFISYKYDTVDPVNFKNFVSCMYEDSQGNFWTGTWKGLFMFDRNEKKYYDPDFLNNVKGIYFFNRGNEFIAFEDHINFRNDIQNCRYNDIFEDKNGIYWFATNCGLLKYDPNLNKLTYFESQAGDPTSLCFSALRKIIEDPMTDNGNLWISSYWGLNHFDKETGNNTQYFHDPVNSQSLPYSVIHGLYADNDGLLWIGNENSGVSILNLMNTHYEYYQIESIQDKNQLFTATSFYKDRDGFTWVGTNKGGLFKYDQEMSLVDHYNLYLSDINRKNYGYVYSIYETDDRLLMVGTLRGLLLYDRTNNEFIPCALISGGFPLQSARINAIFNDSFGWHWAGTGGVVKKGLFYQKPETKKTKDFLQVIQDPLDHLDIRDFYEDKEGVLWVATNGGGIYLLNPENRDSVNFEKFELTSNNSSLLNTLTIYDDQNGVLWFGGYNGLTKYAPQNGSITIFNSGNGLKVDAIYDIEGDGQYLWLSSDKGLLRFDPEATQNEMVKITQLSDGIPFEDIYPYDIYRSEDGKIHIGGKRGSGNGFFRFHPDNIKENQHIPPVVITSFRVKNKPFPLDSNIIGKKHLILRYNQNYFSFDFVALDYVNPGRNQYTYKLEGIDEGWVQSGNRRFVNYTGIGPGSYLFRVKGSNNDGVWNEDGISMAITILPPPWRTWWAYSLYILFIISILYMVIRFYLRRQRLIHKLEMEQLQTEKLEELDKMKSHFFTNISHEFRTPLTLILGPVAKVLTKIKDESIRQDLSMMQRNARRLQKLINQLLSLSKLESGKLKLYAKEDNIVSLVSSYVQSFESLAKQKNIKLDFKSDKEIIRIYFDQDKIENILNNLLSNAFKFTDSEGSVAIKISAPSDSLPGKEEVQPATHNLQPATGYVEINVSDTGKGIESAKLPHIFDRFFQADDNYTKDQEGTGIGLALTKELVELHHGSITVESILDKGTTFTVFLPTGKEHLKKEEIGESVVREDSFGEFDYPQEQIAELQDQEILIDDDAETKDEKPLLLMVEDNDDLRSYIRSYLTSDYRISEAIDGEMGLAKAIDKIPDLIISDVMMPKMDGMQFCRKLKTDERTSHIPVILLTAKAAKEDKLEGLQTGADDFLTKPFDPEELLIRISNLIGQREKLKEKYKSRFVFPEARVQEEIMSSDDKFLNKAGHFIEQNIVDPDLSVETFAQQMAMSQSQLYRKLKALVGLSPNEFIRSIRLNKAAVLLSKHTGNVAEIAYEVGFNNPSWFSECFQKQFGMPPSQWAGKNS